MTIETLPPTKPDAFQQLKKEGERLRELIRKQQRTIEILVAAGFISIEKVKHAEALAELP